MTQREEALEAVRSWRAQGGTEMWHGFPIDAARPYLQGKGRAGVLSHAGVARLSRLEPATRVPLEGLVATQPDVGLRDVEMYLADPGAKVAKGVIGKTGALLDLPIVVRYRGIDYIHDGHHRLTAERLAGVEDANVRLIDADAIGLDAWAAKRG